MFSAEIESVIAMFDKAKTDYAWNSEKVNEMDKATQDYLHTIELDGLNYEERAKVATKLMKCRKDRRRHKDTVITLEPLVEYLDTENGKRLVNLLREALGKTRKVESYMKSRAYFPRIVKDGE